jgi:hypothetical protein
MMTGRTRAPPEPVSATDCEKDVAPTPVAKPEVKAPEPTKIGDDDEEDLKKAWMQFDHSLKGSISPSQFRQIMAGLGENVNDAEVEGIINSVDGEGKISCKSIYFSFFLSLLECVRMRG